MEYYPIQMDIISYYLFSKSATLKFSYPKFDYVTIQK